MLACLLACLLACWLACWPACALAGMAQQAILAAHRRARERDGSPLGAGNGRQATRSSSPFARSASPGGGMFSGAHAVTKKPDEADEPKPPKTALACFRSTLKGDALKGAAKTWSEMSDASKLSFERSAEIDKLRHRKEMIAHLSAGRDFKTPSAKRHAERFMQDFRGGSE